MSFDVFRNHKRSGKEELDSYIPSWYQEILEMRANNEFAGYTMDRMADSLEDIIINQFIQTCDVQTLEKFERFLKIKNTTEDIEIRRKKVHAYWNGNRTMNRTRIKELIRIYMGCDSRVWFDHVLHTMVESDSPYPKEFTETMFDQIPSHVKWVPAYGIKFDHSIVEQMILKKISVKTGINFWINGTLICYNGETKYYGKRAFGFGKNKRYKLDILFRNKSFVKTEEKADLSQSEYETKINTETVIDAAQRFKAEQKTEEKNGTYIRMSAAQYLKEKIGNLEVVTQTPDCKFFDGKTTFSGNTKYNNKYRKEVEA